MSSSDPTPLPDPADPPGPAAGSDAPPPGPDAFDQVRPSEPPPHIPASPPADPWAHRRGEPRVVAFFWTLYVLLAVAGSVTWVARFATITPDSYAPGARIMIIVLAVGATMLWPMVRLCQSVPDGTPMQGGPVSSVAADLVVILAPLHMTIWPMLFLANWPANIVAAVAACLTGWVLLVGGVLALTQAVLAAPLTAAGQREGPVRSLAMLLVVVLVLAAPISILLSSSRLPDKATTAWLGMLSPLTAVADITGRGLMGPQNAVTPVQWKMIAFAWACAAFVWFLAALRAAFVKPAKPA